MKFVPYLVTALAVAVAGWMGATDRGLAQVMCPVLLFALWLTAFGPQSNEVQGNPSKGLMLFFSLVLASGICGIAYAISHFLFG
ncbi:MAG: hypothetical protein BVN32_03310 [Proteobacteria bacterium ST_bin14]|nr:MAG: hypothetical protein BVN32_03310 [Proteobacteria bacterium ST_bin14]